MVLGTDRGNEQIATVEYSQVGAERQPATANGAACLVSRSQAPIEPTTAAACKRRRSPRLSAQALWPPSCSTSKRAPKALEFVEYVMGESEKHTLP
jgi:hypothetical protein